jgi:cob(I)alamin adenosyltransferase
MLLRTAFVLYVLITVCAVAFHDNTFAVFDLKEQLQWLQINLWELLHQLEYVEPHQRAIVYQEIQHIRSEIQRVVTELVAHDQAQHPLP